MPTDPRFVLNDIWLLRLRALLAKARGDETGYRDYWDRYRAMAITGLRGTHEMGRGDAMTTVGPMSYPGVPK